MIERQLTYPDLGVTPGEIYSQMGYGDSTPDDATKAETEGMCREIEAFLQPRFCFFICDGELDVDGCRLSAMGYDFNIGRIITRQLKGSRRFVFFVATAGNDFESFQRSLTEENDMVRVFIANAIGSVLAEKTADVMEVELEKLLDAYGWKHTNRFSPGYCGWHVREQQHLFPIFPGGNPCGVRLTDSSLMIPIKSVSGVIGIGPDVRKLEYTCGLCDYAQCYKRKKPSKHQQ